jgi:hypothetical protein
MMRRMKAKKEFKIHVPRWEELPDIDLYLDQVVTFIDRYLSEYIKNDFNNQENEENKILTKTMINNYVKQKIIEAPVKKKYNRNNVAYLIVICILKQVYSISDISKLIKIGLRHTPIDIAYNTFCVSLEDAIDSTFNGNKEKFDYTNVSSVEYLLFNVVQTFASKLYVQKKFLRKCNQKNS